MQTVKLAKHGRMYKVTNGASVAYYETLTAALGKIIILKNL